MVYKAELESHTAYFAFNHANNVLISNVVNSLSCVIEFNFAYSEVVHSGHLEQLAIACPNLQRLNLQGNYRCLKSLKGLHALGSHCRDLCGLNFKYIQISDIEDHLELWKILSDMKLTYLVIEVCVFQPVIDSNGRDAYESQLIGLYQKCSSLEALQFESFYNDDICDVCPKVEVGWSFLLSHFPVLKYCKLHGNDSNLVQDILSGCKGLCILSCSSMEHLLISSVFTTSLQQLRISADDSNIPDIFMETVSAHGGLVHVFLSVHSITVDGITGLFVNSPRLLTLNIYSRHIVERYEWNKTVAVYNLKETLQEMFPSRKLFAVGGFKVYTLHFQFVLGTDFMPLWHA